MSNRIKSAFQHGKGDTGISQLLNGEFISKAAVSCDLYSANEWLRQTVGKLIYRIEVEHKPFLFSELNWLIPWLDDAIFAFSSFCWSKGHDVIYIDSATNLKVQKNYLFPDHFLRFLEDIDSQLDLELEDCPEFIKFWTHEHLLLLNELVLRVRDVERLFIKFWESPEITRECRLHEELTSKFSWQVKILNRLSSTLFTMTRKEGVLLNEKLSLDSKYWVSKMPEWKNSGENKVLKLA